jgi:hypothetical protein
MSTKAENHDTTAAPIRSPQPAKAAHHGDSAGRGA